MTCTQWGVYVFQARGLTCRHGTSVTRGSCLPQQMEDSEAGAGFIKEPGWNRDGTAFVCPGRGTVSVVRVAPNT